MGKKSIIVKGEVVEMSFDEAYTQFERFVYHMVQKMSAKDPEPEDVLQIARIALWKAYMTYDASRGIAFTSYAGRAIEISIMRLWRRRKRRLLASSLDAKVFNTQGNSISFHERTPAPENDLDTIISVRETMAKIKEKERQILVENLIFEHSQSQIAHRLGIGQSSVSRTIRHAKEQFKYLYTKKTATAATVTALKN